MGNRSLQCARHSDQQSLAKSEMDINLVLRTVHPKNHGNPYSGASSDHHMVYKRIYVSGSLLPRNTRQLQEYGITHVLNVAEGSWPWDLGDQPSIAGVYGNAGIKYKGIPCSDTASYNIRRDFECAFKFMDDALLSSNLNCVLVHCLQGFSRSPTIVAAYLMKRKGLSAAKAIEKIRETRIVHPNYGFVRILAAYELELRADTDQPDPEDIDD